ncbi:MAG: hypothetical protein MJ252_16175, partial [archaeon]|nr:hypothetical protein [archaeon]
MTDFKIKYFDWCVDSSEDNSIENEKNIQNEENNLIPDLNPIEISGCPSDREKEKETMEIKRKKNIDILKYKIQTLLDKKRFHSILELLEDKMTGLRKEQNVYFEIMCIKFRAQFELIENKLRTFNYQTLSFKYNPNGEKEKKLNEKFEILEIEIQLFFSEIEREDMIKDDLSPKYKKKELREKMIQIFTNLSLLKAKYCLIKGRLADAMSLLSINHNILKEYVKNKKAIEERTLYIYEETLIHLSTLLIHDGSYISAIELSAACIRVCLMEIFTKSQGEVDINLSALKEKEHKFYTKIIQRMSVCYYQIGICNEFIGFGLGSIEAYKEANWFAKKYLHESNPKFDKLCTDSYSKLFELKARQKEIDRRRRENEALEEARRKRLKELQKKYKALELISQGKNYHQIKRMKKLTKEAKAVEVPKELQTIRSGEYKNKENMMGTLIVYNDLLSEDYTDFIINTGMKDLIGINKKKRVKDKLEKYTNNLRFAV